MDNKDTKEASQPFSVGPRSCIGRKYVSLTDSKCLSLILVCLLIWLTTIFLAGYSFAYMEMSLILTKLIFMYDMELVDKGLDWEGRSHVHVQWWKPELRVSFAERKN